MHPIRLGESPGWQAQSAGGLLSLRRLFIVCAYGRVRRSSCGRAPCGEHWGLMQTLVRMQRDYYATKGRSKSISLLERGSQVALLRHSWSGMVEHLSADSVSRSLPAGECSIRCYENERAATRGELVGEEHGSFQLAACAVGARLEVAIFGNGSTRSDPPDLMTVVMTSPGLKRPVHNTYRVNWRTPCGQGVRVCCSPPRRISGAIEITLPRKAGGAARHDRRCQLVPREMKMGTNPEGGL
jgi:hypothetical protein